MAETVIRRMAESEREETTCLVDKAMQRQYGCKAHALPSVVIVAARESVILGAMSIFLSDGAPLPLEERYILDYASFPCVFERKTVAHFGRWSASIAGIAEHILYGSIRYALGRGCLWGISEMKPYVVRHFGRMGIRPVVLQGRLLLEKIANDVRHYYTDPPMPLLCAVDLRGASAQLFGRVGPALAGGGVSIAI